MQAVLCLVHCRRSLIIQGNLKPPCISRCAALLHCGSCIPSVAMERNLFVPTGEQQEQADEKLVYGVENNSTLLECCPRSPQAKVLWFKHRGAAKDEVGFSLVLYFWRAWQLFGDRVKA